MPSPVGATARFWCPQTAQCEMVGGNWAIRAILKKALVADLKPDIQRIDVERESRVAVLW